MLSDIYTIMWKESRSWLRYQGSKSRTLVTLITPLLAAMLLPWQIGASWIDGYIYLFLAFLVPTMIAGLTVPDSFAGEKERNTLPTLLASRLPDRAILFGKMLFGILLGWAAGLLVLVISLISANISFGGEPLLFYSPSVLGAYLGFSLMMATLTAGAGVLISMRAKSAQEANQLLISILLLFPLMLGMASTMFLRGKEDALAELDISLILLIVAAVLLVVTVALVLAAMRRFQRAKLVFD
jgi:ABC-2 type transport system permease protein